VSTSPVFVPTPILRSRLQAPVSHPVASISNNPHTGVQSGLLADNGGRCRQSRLDPFTDNPALMRRRQSRRSGRRARAWHESTRPMCEQRREHLRSRRLRAAGRRPAASLVVTTLADVVARRQRDIAARALTYRQQAGGAKHITFDCQVRGRDASRLTHGELAISSDVTSDGGRSTATIAPTCPPIDAHGHCASSNVTAGSNDLLAWSSTGRQCLRRWAEPMWRPPRTLQSKREWCSRPPVVGVCPTPSRSDVTCRTGRQSQPAS